MTTQEIIAVLVEQKGYDKAQTERLAPKIEALPEDIRTALENWVQTGELTSPVYADYDVKKILEKQPAYKEIAAYLTLDWLRRDPAAATAQLNRPVLRFMTSAKGGK